MKIFLTLLLFVTFSSSASIKVALTVDDLPAHETLPEGMSREEVAQRMLLVLKKHNIREAYGFINGDQLKWGHEKVLKLWLEAGYPMANHTFSHLDLNKSTLEEYKKDILLNGPVLLKLNQKAKIFRYPFLHEGDTLEKRNTIRKFLKTSGHSIAQVTLYWEDYAWNTPYARCLKKNDLVGIQWLRDSFLASALEALKSRDEESRNYFKRPIAHILLYHIGAFDAEALDNLLSAYKSKGVEFIPLQEAMKDEAYQVDSQFVSPDGRDFIQQLYSAKKIPVHQINIPHKKLSEICL